MPESEKKEESAESREEAKEQVCNKQKKKKIKKFLSNRYNIMPGLCDGEISETSALPLL